jgi:hypothetical protein
MHPVANQTTADFENSSRLPHAQNWHYLGICFGAIERVWASVISGDRKLPLT